MRNITIHMGRGGPRVSVRETETPGTWELEWTGDIEQRHAHRMLKAAENYRPAKWRRADSTHLQHRPGNPERRTG